jgi:hypothetical protein
MGMELRTSGFGVVEVAPRKDVHLAHVQATGLLDQLTE